MILLLEWQFRIPGRSSDLPNTEIFVYIQGSHLNLSPYSSVGDDSAN